MKKFIALLISASVIAAPVAFAADEAAGSPDAAMQQMTGNDQAANNPAPAAKPAAKKGHRQCHCKNCAHKHHRGPAKQPASSEQ